MSETKTVIKPLNLVEERKKIAENLAKTVEVDNPDDIRFRRHLNVGYVSNPHADRPAKFKNHLLTE